MRRGGGSAPRGGPGWPPSAGRGRRTSSRSPSRGPGTASTTPLTARRRPPGTCSGFVTSGLTPRSRCWPITTRKTGRCCGGRGPTGTRPYLPPRTRWPGRSGCWPSGTRSTAAARRPALGSASRWITGPAGRPRTPSGALPGRLFASPGNECDGEPVVPYTPTDRRMRVIAGAAIAGAIPLTLGAIFWIVGSAMGLASHPGWGGLAQAGVVMMLAGLACGLIVIAAGAIWQPRAPGIPAGPAQKEPPPDGLTLTPLASPEQQEYLSRRSGQPPGPAYQQPAGPAPYPQPEAMPAYPAAGPGPAYPQPGAPWAEPAVQWPDPGIQQAWTPPPGLGDEQPRANGRHRSDQQRRDDDRREYGSGRA